MKDQFLNKDAPEPEIMKDQFLNKDAPEPELMKDQFLNKDAPEPELMKDQFLNKDSAPAPASEDYHARCPPPPYKCPVPCRGSCCSKWGCSTYPYGGMAGRQQGICGRDRSPAAP